MSATGGGFVGRRRQSFFLEFLLASAEIIVRLQVNKTDYIKYYC